jgi:hypothetical protein
LCPHLESGFNCHFASDTSSTFVFPTAADRSQVLTVRDCNDIWAEVRAAVGKGLDHPALATALRTLSDFGGAGAVLHARSADRPHGLAYAGLTIESTLRTISAGAHAADRAAGGSDLMDRTPFPYVPV